MINSKTISQIQPSFSSADGEVTLRLHAPKTWGELTQKQLHYTLTMLSQDISRDEVKAYMFIRFSGIDVVGRRKEGWKTAVVGDDGKRHVVFLDRLQVTDLLSRFDYIDSYEGMDVRLDRVQNLYAVDILLHGLPFIDYLNAEKAYQGFMMSRDEKPLKNLVRILYRDKDGNAVRDVRPDAAEGLGTILWYSFVKSEMNKAFPNFFRPIGDASDNGYDVISAMNAQIRALTEGDITKEDVVLQKDCWRALTELDAKAREAAEMKKIMDKNKQNN